MLTKILLSEWAIDFCFSHWCLSEVQQYLCSCGLGHIQGHSLFSTVISHALCIFVRRLWLCDWLVKTFCRCCSSPPHPRNRRHSYSTGLSTEYSTVNDFHNRSSRAVGSRRHSGTPYVKVTLNEKENEILLKHIRKNGRNYRDHHDSDDMISSV